MKIRILAVVVLFFSTLSGGISPDVQVTEANEGTASAKCAVPTVHKARERSKAVFSGEVIREEKNGDVKTFTFKVEKFWKGEDSREIDVFVYQTARYQSPFREGEKFLVYAYEREDGSLTVSRCSRVRDLRYAEDDLRELGKGKTPSK
jgi:hypothetical protein